MQIPREWSAIPLNCSWILYHSFKRCRDRGFHYLIRTLQNSPSVVGPGSAQERGRRDDAKQPMTHIFKPSVSDQWHWQDTHDISDRMWKHRPWKPIYFIYPQFNLLRSSKASFIDCYEYWARPACRLEPLVYSADWRSKDRFRLKTWIFDGIKWAPLRLTDNLFIFLSLFEELISAFKLDQIRRLLFL